MSAQDVLDSVPIAHQNAAILTQMSNKSLDDIDTLEHFTANRLTAHLQEAVLYLQLQVWGVRLPTIEVTELEHSYPFVKLEKHQEDALFQGFVRHEMFASGNMASGRLHSREEWENVRNLGLLPNTRWEDVW